MSEIRFYKTNDKDDPGFVMDTAEVAEQFWASPEAREWLAKYTGRLERLALNWVAHNIGQWDNLKEDWAAIFEAIHSGMPRVGL